MLLLLRAQTRLRPDQVSIQQGGLLLAFRSRPAAVATFRPFQDNQTPISRIQIIYNRVMNIISNC
jgi:hypothetical protein